MDPQAGVTADQFLNFLTQATFFAVFLVTAAAAFRAPRRSRIDTALFFGALAVIIAVQWVTAALHLPAHPASGAMTGGLAMALPYLMLRLVDDFSGVAPRIMGAAAVGLAGAVLLVATLPMWPQDSPVRFPLTGLLVAYFVVLAIYVAARFVTGAQRASGVTRRRLQAAAAGCALLGLVILLTLPTTLFPELRPVWMVVSRLAGLASGLAFFLGFAPPPILRRAWQEPELRSFLGRAARLPRLASTDEIVSEITRGVSASLGAPYATVGLWDEHEKVLRYAPLESGGEWEVVPAERYIAGRAFTQQRAILSENAARDDPESAAVYRAAGTKAILAAPITAGSARLGVLVAYAPNPPIFADDDLVLIRLLADQAAVVLESRKLIDDAAGVRAREEVTRLRDDFLSSAAHDLKTPLTTLLAQAQLLERKVARDPSAPADAKGIHRLVVETRRLNGLVLELLDAARAEQGRILGQVEVADLVEIARQVAARLSTDRHPVRMSGNDRVIAELDSMRIDQVLSNLIENSAKYSPEGGEIELRVWQEGDSAYFSVMDRGIGIPAADVPYVFDRFHRGGNVDDRQFAGMGLGLYICRAIVEAHHGQISVVSARPGGAAGEAAARAERAGSTFTVSIPLVQPAGPATGAEAGPGLPAAAIRRPAAARP